MRRSGQRQRAAHDSGIRAQESLNDWQFYYDLGYNRGFAINGPTVKVALPSAILRPGETPDAGQAQTPNLNCNLDR